MKETLSPCKVLIVTGCFVSVKDTSFYHVLRKQIASFKSSSGAWYDIDIKVVVSENQIKLRMYQASRAFRRSPYRKQVEHFLTDSKLFDSPDLTEVLLATLLKAEEIPFEAITYSELFSDPQLRDRLLSETNCVFASTTLLRDLSELWPMLRLLKKPHNRVVIGGALAGFAAADWPGSSDVDVVAVGYGELLTPALAAWIKSNFKQLVPPRGGSLARKQNTQILQSGVLASRNLDHLVTPDWSLAERYHGKKFEVVHYESARGCPFRCAFCSFPFLFDDRVYRTKSARRIAEEWQLYAGQGVRFISCLDSNFTSPRKRLVELCETLIRQKSPIQWITYARGSDLIDPKICQLMQRAGCLQVHIGVESGNQAILDAMNKRCKVESNAKAIENCRRTGISTHLTVILGFPGETEATIDDTYTFIRDTQPDFAYATPFTVRMPNIPILSVENRTRYDLHTRGGLSSSSPYFRHQTMGSDEIGYHWRRLHRRMILERAALDPSLFFKGMLSYRRAEHRHMLLDFQHDLVTHHPIVSKIFDGLQYLSRNRLTRDMARLGI